MSGSAEVYEMALSEVNSNLCCIQKQNSCQKDLTLKEQRLVGGYRKFHILIKTQ